VRNLQTFRKNILPACSGLNLSGAREQESGYLLAVRTAVLAVSFLAENVEEMCSSENPVNFS
jgi:hypothetical protein